MRAFTLALAVAALLALTAHAEQNDLYNLYQAHDLQSCLDQSLLRLAIQESTSGL